MLNKKELIKLDGEKITVNELKIIEENENIIEVLNLGMSGLYYGYNWYCVITKDEEINLYVKEI